MPRKKKPPAPTPARIGRPPVYGDRVRWLVHVPVDLAEQVDKWRGREKLSRAAAVEQALRQLLDTNRH